MTAFAHSIKTSIILFPFVALLITFPYIIYQYHKYGSINAWRTIIVYSFALYCLTAYFLVILPLPTKEYVLNMKPPVNNFKPFMFIVDIFKKTDFQINDFATYFPTMKNPTFYEAIFNIFLTVPLGVYLHYYFKCSFKKTLLISFGVTLFFELTQLSGLYFLYPKPYRVFDVDDLILNTFGGVIGYFLANIFNKILPTRDEIDAKSYQKGQQVSFFRRIVSSVIDFICLFSLLFIFGFYIYQTSLTKIFLIIPIIIYLLICLIYKRTVGMALLNLSFATIKDDVTRPRIIVYYLVLFIEYLCLPIISILVSYNLYNKGYFNQSVFEYMLVVIFALYLMALIIGSFKRILKMPLTCEKISKIFLKSNIMIEEVIDE